MAQRAINSRGLRVIADLSVFLIITYVAGNYLYMMFGGCIPAWRQVSESLYDHGIVAEPVTMAKFVADPVLSVISLMANNLGVTMTIHAAILLFIGSLLRSRMCILKYTILCAIVLCIASIRYVLLNWVHEHSFFWR